ncbi:DUF5316 domain-containing protein [Neobacillus terrae]|uniref:DUF5316 domain-containing protein n=1 Tax=Neobacillus terrae TaxID=3034837 RepID=UPI0014080650|nr:DUF5316 domain-containing protein [Neobacillus terrae]NHM30953.1 DUF5316 domain-containing protein [Neobacillus terrae]
MNKILIGISIVLAAVLVSVFLSDFTLLYKITGAVAGLSLIIGALFSGAFVDGDRMGRNLNSESEEDRNKRYFVTNSILLIGLPSILMAAISYFLIK